MERGLGGSGRRVENGEGGREEEAKVSSQLKRARGSRPKEDAGAERKERTSIGWFQVANAPPIVEQAILSRAVSLSSFDRPRTDLI